MITSAKQLTVTKKRLAQMEEAVGAFDVDAVPEGVHPAAHAAQLRALVGIRDELIADIRQYERLLAEGVTAVCIEKLSDIPTALIQARIAKGLSQAALANLMSVRPQQVQRWERERYENAGFAVVLDAAEALGLADKIKLVSSDVEATAQPRSANLPSHRVDLDERPSAVRISWGMQGYRRHVQITETEVIVTGRGGIEAQYTRHVSTWRTAASEVRSFAPEDPNA